MISPGKTSFISGVITNVALAILGIATSFGLELTQAQTTAILFAVSVLGFLVTFTMWMFTVPREQVLEKLIGDTVVAGQANDIVEPNTEIRKVEYEL